MSKHRHSTRDLTRDALRRIDKARASYIKSEHRVASARQRLGRAEAKLVRRAARLAAAEDLVLASAMETSAPKVAVVAAMVEEVDQIALVDLIEDADLVDALAALTPLSVEPERNGTADATPSITTMESRSATNGAAPHRRAHRARRGAGKAGAQRHDEAGATGGTASDEAGSTGEQTPPLDDASH